MTSDPIIGIIMLDTTFPRIPGDVGNPASFDFPVHYKTVRGATVGRVVTDADPTLLEPFIQAAVELEQEGVRAIATSCGFLAIFQRELSDAVRVPVFSSSLLQVHAASAVLKKGQITGILTAQEASLTARHFVGVGLDRYSLAIQGMDEFDEFPSVFMKGKPTINIDKTRQEMKRAAQNLVTRHPEVGAVVMECTNMPPYAADVQEAVGLPVYDVITMINYAYSIVRYRRYDDWF